MIIFSEFKLILTIYFISFIYFVYLLQLVLDNCEFLSGIYKWEQRSYESMVVNIDRYTGKIWGHFFNPGYGNFVGLVESETENECIGNINFSNYLSYTFKSKAEECTIRMYSGTSYVEHYKKTFCCKYFQ